MFDLFFVWGVWGHFGGVVGVFGGVFGGVLEAFLMCFGRFLEGKSKENRLEKLRIKIFVFIFWV